MEPPQPLRVSSDTEDEPDAAVDAQRSSYESHRPHQSVTSRGKLRLATMGAPQSPSSVSQSGQDLFPPQSPSSKIGIDSLTSHPTVQASRRKTLLHLIAGLGDDDGNVDMDALAEALQEHSKHRRQNKHLKGTVALMVFAILVTIVAMLATSVLGANLAKETHPDKQTGILSTVGGVPIKTEPAAYYATLVDLPKFGREQLSKIESLDLIFEDGLMHYKISGYSATAKNNLTLFTTGAATVEIDSTLGTAVVKHGNGITIPVFTEQPTRRLLLNEKKEAKQPLNCNSNGACLFTIDELHRIHGFDDTPGRSLLRDGTRPGMNIGRHRQKSTGSFSGCKSCSKSYEDDKHDYKLDEDYVFWY